MEQYGLRLIHRTVEMPISEPPGFGDYRLQSDHRQRVAPKAVTSLERKLEHGSNGPLNGGGARSEANRRELRGIL